MKRLLLILLLLPALAAAGDPPDNRPPDNRPPGSGGAGGQGGAGGAGGDVDIDIGGVNVGGTTVNTPVDVSAPTTVNSPVSMNNETKTFAFSNSLGDVDIGGCLGSTQWATPVFSKQGLVLNWPCLAEFYLRNGKYELAAMAICNTEVVKEFEGKGISKDEAEASCEAAHDFAPMMASIEPAAAPTPIAQHDQDVEELVVAQHQLEEQVALLQIELEATKNRPPPPPQRVERVVEKEPELTDAEKYAILGLLMAEGAEEDE